MHQFFAQLTPIRPLNTIDQFAVWHSSATEMQFKNSPSQQQLQQLREVCLGMETYLYGQIKHYFSPHDGFGHREALPERPFACFFRDARGFVIVFSASKSHGICLFFHEASNPTWRKSMLNDFIAACKRLKDQLKDDVNNFDIPLDHSLNWLSSVNVTTMVHVLPLDSINPSIESLHEGSEGIVGERPKTELNIASETASKVGQALLAAVIVLSLVEPTLDLINGLSSGNSALFFKHTGRLVVLYFVWRGSPWSRYLLGGLSAFSIVSACLLYSKSMQMVSLARTLGTDLSATAANNLLALTAAAVAINLYIAWVVLFSKHARVFLNTQYNRHN